MPYEVYEQGLCQCIKAHHEHAYERDGRHHLVFKPGRPWMRYEKWRKGGRGRRFTKIFHTTDWGVTYCLALIEEQFPEYFDVIQRM